MSDTEDATGSAVLEAGGAHQNDAPTVTPTGQPPVTPHAPVVLGATSAKILGGTGGFKQQAIEAAAGKKGPTVPNHRTLQTNAFSKLSTTDGGKRAINKVSEPEFPGEKKVCSHGTATSKDS